MYACISTGHAHNYEFRTKSYSCMDESFEMYSSERSIFFRLFKVHLDSRLQFIYILLKKSGLSRLILGTR